MRCTSLIAVAIAATAAVIPAFAAPTGLYDRDFDESDMLVARFIHDTLRPRPRPQPPVVVTTPAGDRNVVHNPPRGSRGNGRRSEMFDYEEYLQRRMDMAGYYDELD